MSLDISIFIKIVTQNLHIFRLMRFVTKRTSTAEVQEYAKRKFVTVVTKNMPSAITTYKLCGVKHRHDGPAVIRGDGIVEWWLNGELHRDGAPAIHNESMTIMHWYKHGFRHNAHGPAIVVPGSPDTWYKNGELHSNVCPATVADGMYYWYNNGTKHRKGGPAVYNEDMSIQEYYKYDSLHRKDGPAVINRNTNTLAYYKNGVLHRKHGPARITDDRLEYFFYGVYHREVGPAIINKKDETGKSNRYYTLGRSRRQNRLEPRF